MLDASLDQRRTHGHDNIATMSTIVNLILPLTITITVFAPQVAPNNGFQPEVHSSLSPRQVDGLYRDTNYSFHILAANLRGCASPTMPRAPSPSSSSCRLPPPPRAVLPVSPLACPGISIVPPLTLTSCMSRYLHCPKHIRCISEPVQVQSAPQTMRYL